MQQATRFGVHLHMQRYWPVYAAFAAAIISIILFGTGVLKGTNPPPVHPNGEGPDHAFKDPRFPPAQTDPSPGGEPSNTAR